MTARHRPAVKRRRFRHDEYIAGDLFSGFGGLTQGIERAGFTTIVAANHNEYKVKIHEANHPTVQHWIADLVDPESSDYHSVRELPPVDLLAAGVSCTNHTPANTKKAYRQGLTLFDLDDPEYEARVTRSERDRATANCFPAGTVVVARHGMVPIEQLAIGDEVLTHLNRWRRVTGRMSHVAPTVAVKGSGHTALEVTSSHRFLTRRAHLGRRGWTFSDTQEWTEAGNLVGHAWQSPVEFPVTDAPSAPEGWRYNHLFWWTVGRWLGDGWIRHCRPSEMVGVGCGYDERHEPDGRWPTAPVIEAPTTVQYELRGSGSLARWLIENFGEHAHSKTIPTWALGMDADHRRALVAGYMSADGCASLGGRRGSCATASRRLAIGMKLILQSLGYRPTLRCRELAPLNIEDRPGTTRPMWFVQWMAHQRRTSTITTVDGRCVGVVREVTDHGREAEVFDIEVEEDHSFLADGIIVHNCVLHYAAQHHPRLILVECTTELASWGRLVPGRRKVGDGSTYRWWLKQFALLGYRYKVLYLNSMFFGVGQSRDRGFWVFWDRKLPTPDLDHRPESWCGRCQSIVQARWSWKTGVPPTGTVRYGKQYNYRCPSCGGEVVPPFTPSLDALDLSNLGTRIGDRDRPLAPATMARAERCRQRFREFPAVLMPAKSQRGTARHPWQPAVTQTSQQETAVLSSGALMAAAGNTSERPGSDCRIRHFAQPLPAQTATNGTALVTPPVAVAVDNFQGSPRAVHEPLPTQGGSETMGLLSARILPNRTNGTSRSLGEPMETIVGNAGSGGLGVLSCGVLPYRRHTTPTAHAEAMPTVTADQVPGLLTAAGVINNGSIAEARYRTHPMSCQPGTVGAEPAQARLFSGWHKQNGSTGTETAPHPVTDAFGTLTARDTTAILAAEWRDALADLKLEDCFFRMMLDHEIGRGCGFDVDFAGHRGSFRVWGSARDRVDGYGNAVTPQVGWWIGGRLRAVLHGEAGRG